MLACTQGIKFVLLLSRQGKVRLSKWYTTYNQKERSKIVRDITPLVLGRSLKLCNFLDYQDIKVGALACELSICLCLSVQLNRCLMTDGSSPRMTPLQVVYKRYASLYFVMGIDVGDNELITLELIHHYVEVLDRYFGNVCELDLIFNFHKVRRMLPPSLSRHAPCNATSTHPRSLPTGSSGTLQTQVCTCSIQSLSGGALCFCLVVACSVTLASQRVPAARVCFACMQAYFILDEMLIAGELQEPSKKVRGGRKDAHATVLCGARAWHMQWGVDLYADCQLSVANHACRPSLGRSRRRTGWSRRPKQASWRQRWAPMSAPFCPLHSPGQAASAQFWVLRLL